MHLLSIKYIKLPLLSMAAPEALEMPPSIEQINSNSCNYNLPVLLGCFLVLLDLAVPNDINSLELMGPGN